MNLIFNFVFIFEVEADTSPFEPVVQKIGEAFKIYEVSFDVYLFLHRKYFIALLHCLYFVGIFYREKACSCRLHTQGIPYLQYYPKYSIV